MLTTLGENHQASLNSEERRVFTLGQMVSRWEKYAGTNICTSFEPRQYVIDRLAARRFRLVDFIPGALPGRSKQDIYLLKKVE